VCGAYPLNRSSERRHVALKLFTDSKSIGAEKETEINVFNLIDKTLKIRPGRKAVRSLLNSFEVEGPGGRHRNPVEKLPATVVAHTLKRLFTLWIFWIMSAMLHTLTSRRQTPWLEQMRPCSKRSKKRSFASPPQEKKVMGEPYFCRVSSIRQSALVSLCSAILVWLNIWTMGSSIE
jgi:hypothetical protein